MPVDFDKREYWHQRFAAETHFEWLVPSAPFMALVAPYLDQQQQEQQKRRWQQQLQQADAPTRVLHVGFGTSDLHNHLRAHGLDDVVNIDYEPLAIERGRQREKEAFGDVRMKYAVADATQLESDLAAVLLPPSPSPSPPAEQASVDGGGDGVHARRCPQFDVVVDKSTVDAISCGGEEAFLRMVAGIHKVLAPGGVWISLSYSATRFEVEGLPFEVHMLAKIPTAKARETDPDIYHWCYLLKPKQ